MRKAFADVIITAENKTQKGGDEKKTTVSIIHFKKGYGTLKAENYNIYRKVK